MKINRSPLWRMELAVWGQRLVVPSADRLLYAAFHRVGLMGREDRRFFQAQLSPGMTVLDIGSNLGLYALLFSQLVGERGRVYAFEPDADLYAALERAARLNRRENLRLFNVALGEKAETRLLKKCFFNSGDNRVAAAMPSAPAADEEAAPVTMARGDDLLADEPGVDFIKIDVQGWELHALRGLRGTIERNPNVQIYLEFWLQGLRGAGTDPADLFEFLEGCGLTIFREQDGRWEQVHSWAKLTDSLKDSQFINLWAKKRA
jgi:FkbM family methyltransferase